MNKEKAIAYLRNWRNSGPGNCSNLLPLIIDLLLEGQSEPTKPQTYGEKIAEERITVGETSNYARLTSKDETFDVCSTSMRNGLDSKLKSFFSLDSKLKSFFSAALDEAFEAEKAAGVSEYITSRERPE
jgi:hypothetical protein